MASILRFAKQTFVKHPLISNCLIYGTLYVTSEFSQQLLTKKLLSNSPEDIDKLSLGRYAIMGTCIYSPILYNWYKWLDKTFPGNTTKIIAKKLLLDQFLCTPPLLVIFFTGMSLMELATDPFAECREKFLPTFVRSCLFWLPAQTINFWMIPPQFRVVYVGSCALIWCNILCYVKRQNVDSN